LIDNIKTFYTIDVYELNFYLKHVLIKYYTHTKKIEGFTTMVLKSDQSSTQ